MPYLAVGSALLVRNDCNGASCVLPVTGCAAVARLFNDRCVTAGPPRGPGRGPDRASFVALGGELDRGLLQRHHHDWPLTCRCWP